MAITTQPELLQAVSDAMARSDLTAFIPDFVTMAENWLNYGSENVPPLRVKEMEATASLVPVSGVVTLPTDFLEWIRVSENTSYKRTLAYVTSDEAERLYPDGAAGLGERFSIVGTSLYTYPLVSNNVNLIYYQAIPALTASAPTNWLLTKAPGIYLRATLVQAYAFIKDTAEMTTQAQLASALIAGLNRSDMLGKYSRAGLTLRGATP
jgi:hypothetical protein